MNRVAYYRAKKGYTLDKLAGVSGVNRATIHRIEVGTVRPTALTLAKLARALEVDLDTLAIPPFKHQGRPAAGSQL
jgi:transcriptional regulator with XRE-family HTH domain